MTAPITTKMATNRKRSKKVGERSGARTTPTGDSTKVEAIESEEDEQGQEELWDVIEILKGKKSDHVCRGDGCIEAAVVVWRSNLVKDPNDFWPMCDSCQEEHFGGWPDDMEPLNNKTDDISTEGGGLENEATSEETHKQGDAEPPDDVGNTTKNEAADASNEQANEEDEDDKPEEEWDLKSIMSIVAVTHECPIKCSHETCDLPAATVWVSNLKPTVNWYSCLDCQVCFTLSAPSCRY